MTEPGLAGVRVLDFSGEIAGPYCAKLFTFLNAGKQSVVGAAADHHVQALQAQADLVIEAHHPETDTGDRLDVAMSEVDTPTASTPSGR